MAVLGRYRETARESIRHRLPFGVGVVIGVAAAQSVRHLASHRCRDRLSHRDLGGRVSGWDQQHDRN